ncbi:hypothetical protein ABIC47_003501 [Leifsonia sp. 563]|uniref:hypothetical protein n=1 Tax=Leifsonia sp. 563 TaxID=3156412 RepID=UPI0033957BB8
MRELRRGQARRELKWFAALPKWQVTTGFDQVGWPASRWVLHRMYRTAGLGSLTAPDDANRLRWVPLLADLGVNPSAQDLPPSLAWFPWQPWPTNILPPEEGSLEAEDLDALLDVLATHSADGPEQECIAYFGGLSTMDFDTVNMYQLPLRRVPELLSDNGGKFRATPSNLWPTDHSWFVWTDWDLLGTKVSGSEGLMLSLEAQPDLEVIEWRKPDGL